MCVVCVWSNREESHTLIKKKKLFPLSNHLLQRGSVEMNFWQWQLEILQGVGEKVLRYTSREMNGHEGDVRGSEKRIWVSTSCYSTFLRACDHHWIYPVYRDIVTVRKRSLISEIATNMFPRRRLLKQASSANFLFYWNHRRKRNNRKVYDNCEDFTLVVSSVFCNSPVHHHMQYHFYTISTLAAHTIIIHRVLLINLVLC